MKAAVAAAALVLCACGPAVDARQQAPPPVYGFRVVNAYPHDAQAFTQGLVYVDGFLYESTGLHGRSSLRKVRLDTGEVLQRRDVDAAYFAEGLVSWRDRLIQLTWQSGLGFVYDRATFQPLRTFTYAGEGWGLTHDGARLILSDGSADGTLRFIDPESFVETGRVQVRDRGRPVAHLNELEYIRGEIWANVWQTDRIVRIAPRSGAVVGWIDLMGLLPPTAGLSPDAVLNGIAYDAGGDRVFVTGKLWPRLFEIQLRRP